MENLKARLWGNRGLLKLTEELHMKRNILAETWNEYFRYRELGLCKSLMAASLRDIERLRSEIEVIEDSIGIGRVDE